MNEDDPKLRALQALAEKQDRQDGLASKPKAQTKQGEVSVAFLESLGGKVDAALIEQLRAGYAQLGARERGSGAPFTLAEGPVEGPHAIGLAPARARINAAWGS